MSRLLLLAAFSTLLACGGSPVEPVRVGSAAPDFVLPSLAGDDTSLSGSIGKPTVLNFWATWCQPCRGEFPVFEALYREAQVEVVTIALDEDGARSVRPFVEAEGLDYTVLLGDEKTFKRYGGFSIPYTLLLDSSHAVVSIYRGPVREEELRRDLRRVLGESEAVAAER